GIKLPERLYGRIERAACRSRNLSAPGKQLDKFLRRFLEITVAVEPAKSRLLRIKTEYLFEAAYLGQGHLDKPCAFRRVRMMDFQCRIRTERDPAPSVQHRRRGRKPCCRRKRCCTQADRSTADPDKTPPGYMCIHGIRLE